MKKVMNWAIIALVFFVGVSVSSCKKETTNITTINNGSSYVKSSTPVTMSSLPDTLLIGKSYGVTYTQKDTAPSTQNVAVFLVGTGNSNGYRQKICDVTTPSVGRIILPSNNIGYGTYQLSLEVMTTNGSVQVGHSEPFVAAYQITNPYIFNGWISVDVLGGTPSTINRGDSITIAWVSGNGIKNVELYYQYISKTTGNLITDKISSNVFTLSGKFVWVIPQTIAVGTSITLYAKGYDQNGNVVDGFSAPISVVK